MGRVTDEGRDHISREGIKAWLTGSASEYTYTTKFTSATAADAANIDVVQQRAVPLQPSGIIGSIIGAVIVLLIWLRVGGRRSVRNRQCSSRSGAP